jgi:hypothetical protein
MFLQRLWKRATIGAAGEVCAEEERFFREQKTSSLEQRVTRYFEQWRDPVNRYLVAVFGHWGEAEEITQETFLQLYRSLDSGQYIDNVRAWVFRVQKLQVWRRDNRFSARDQAVSLEIWNDAARSRSRQSVTGESGRRFLPITTSAESDGRERYWVPQVLIDLVRILRANHMDPERPLSPGSYQAWRNSLGEKREEVRKSNLTGGDQALTLRTITGRQVEIGRITEAALVVWARDWRPRELRLRVRAEEGEREYGMVETAFEVVGLSALSAEIFPTKRYRNSGRS